MSRLRNERDGVEFCAISAREQTMVGERGIKPLHIGFQCGDCGQQAQHRVVAQLTRDDNLCVHWCLCPCGRQEPSVIVKKDYEIVFQSPLPMAFNFNPRWPAELAVLYDEAAKSFAGGAFTACTMVCRKLLMATACKEGDGDGKSFQSYVEFITTHVLNFPRAKDAIDGLRQIGNDANHKFEMVGVHDAQRAMQIVTYMLDTLYALPNLGVAPAAAPSP